jgi:hypothetical protein
MIKIIIVNLIKVFQFLKPNKTVLSVEKQLLFEKPYLLFFNYN